MVSWCNQLTISPAVSTGKNWANTGGVPSVVTLTLNPALDISSSVNAVFPNHKLRCSDPVYDPGGGGINVARVARRLGQTVLAVVPLGGGAGQRIEDLLAFEGIPLRSVPIRAETRESITIGVSSSEDQYRFVFPGPHVSGEELADCEQAVVEAASNAACVVISGSLPSSVPREAMASLVRAVAPVPVLIDTSGEALQSALQSGAFLVKPSARELAAIAGRELITEAEVIDAARSVLADSNVNTLVVSIGAGGAIVLDKEGHELRLRAPTVQVKSAVGAGDSMVAGIAVGLARGLTFERAIRLGIAAGTATVLTSGTDLCDPDSVEELLPLVVVDGRQVGA